jgi:hypothetical protein
MIPVNELRVGNIVTLTGNEVASPLDIMIDEVNFPITRKRGEYNPIPISPEWVKRINLDNYEFRDDFYISVDHYGECEVTLEEYGEGAKRLPHIKYVHQIQNLFFALTGKELELKEK